MTTDDSWRLADSWIEAWNTHDLDSVMSHYDDSTELTSPVAAQLMGRDNGRVMGKSNVRAYFQGGLKAYPDIRFSLIDVLCGVNSVVLYFTNQKGTRTAEFMELSTSGKVSRVVANYSLERQ